jgi:dihydrofolate reductase
MNKASISIIVAMDKNRLIGVDNRLPWRLPDDMKWFVEKTAGKPVIMGRKTYDSIPPRFKPLRDRHNIILTRNPEYKAAGCTVVHSLNEAITAAGDVPEIIIGGGTQIYAQTLPIAKRIYLTLVAGEFEGDAYFPEFTRSEWEATFRQIHEVDDRHPHRFTWLILERI